MTTDADRLAEMALELRDEADNGNYPDASGPEWSRRFAYACNLLAKKARLLDAPEPSEERVKARKPQT